MQMSAIVEGVKVIGGGAAAGYLDTKFSEKKLAGQGLGTVLAVAGVAAGLTLKSRIAKHALDIGWGAAAFEAGKAVQNKIVGVSGVRGVGRFGGVRGVGALPASHRPLTQVELDAMFNRAMYRSAA